MLLKSDAVRFMKSYTIDELVKVSGLSRKDIRKHLIAQTLKYKTHTPNGYVIDEDDLDRWIKNLPKYNLEKLESIFNNIDELCSVCSDEYYEKRIDESKLSDNWTTNKLNGIKFADFFCGAGGLSLGLVMAGFEPVLGVENNESIYKTYQNNFGKRFTDVSCFNAMDITLRESKRVIIDYLRDANISIICGGFPCQGFSLSGSRVISDERNTLYFDMLEIVNSVRPKYIIMENVLGLATIYGGKVLKKILNDYRSIGYSISYKEINAADYGVAQMRRRIIFIGNKMGRTNVYPAKLIDNPDNYVTCGTILEKYKNLPENAAFNHIFSRHSLEMQQRLLAVPEGKCLYSNYNDSWKKCLKNKPSCTIKGNHGATNIHYELPRVITPREMAALQSFPDNFIFYGTKRSQLLQIGNAVPPYVARAIGCALYDELINY